MTRLTEAQRRMLQSTQKHADPMFHLNGMSARGGGSNTLAVVTRRGLIECDVDGVWSLTAAGLDALERKR